MQMFRQVIQRLGLDGTVDQVRDDRAGIRDRLAQAQRGEDVSARAGGVRSPALGRVPDQCSGQVHSGRHVLQLRLEPDPFHAPVGMGRRPCLGRQRGDRFKLGAEFRRHRVGPPIAEQFFFRGRQLLQ